ncbi:hypothetical protein SEA_SKOG_111 [Gordonia phage Skog]|uniref:Uncharacterized protein n=1 Tax=Gordonia phage Skog TaxID=2704033 RepID=A0A6G6XKG2_9CAUD|nr:hypothetical protein KHQ85_gp111 [Gordonia phage Skog]QIG58263.1 hypothetical protein SEA_SKOG_111 [Gordonia phage Skog]
MTCTGCPCIVSVMTSTTAPTTAPTHFAGRNSNYLSDHLDNGVFDSASSSVGWEIEARWAQELADRSDKLDAKAYATLISAVRAGLPVVLATLATFEGRQFREIRTAIVDDLIVRGGTDRIIASADRLRVREWGFSHDVHLSQILSVSVPATSFEPIEEA